MRKSFIKGLMIVLFALASVTLSALSLQAVMFPIVVNNCEGSSSTTKTKTVMFPIVVPTGDAAVGDAVAADVRLGKTFSSEAAGIGITGIAEFIGGDTCTEALVRRTGQKSCWNGSSWVTPCSNPNPVGQDGALTPGVEWPTQRFTDNSNGTVTDNLTGLIWLKDADCSSGRVTWSAAMTFAAGLSNTDCNLSDGSADGDWRVPTVDELISLLDREYFEPSLSNAQGTGQWTDGDVFNNVRSDNGYWTSTGYAALSTSLPTYKWYVDLGYGAVAGKSMNNIYYVWAVRDAD
ncbi:MAG: DUF1566 domain-containing protein [Candidatus Electrothrix sp. AW2]|nr:DUF1566 domain-containing protein [Candidatus Electrothrix gigas]MCI5225691.1 DUF1566 domain-containing protein [Candidatus Electrothrix gigas]